MGIPRRRFIFLAGAGLVATVAPLAAAAPNDDLLNKLAFDAWVALVRSPDGVWVRSPDGVWTHRPMIGLPVKALKP